LSEQKGAAMELNWTIRGEEKLPAFIANNATIVFM
jgi:hypothetical protein